MTSEIGKIKGKASKAMQYLIYAMGEEKVNLKELQSWELELLINEQLDCRDMRELSGFVALRDNFPKVIFGMMDTRIELLPDPALLFTCIGFGNNLGFSLDVHTLWGSRRKFFCPTYKHKETGEITTNYDTASKWGKNGYLARAGETFLVLRRLPLGFQNEPVLVRIDFGYQKVVGEKKYLIDLVQATALPVSDFCLCFGDKAAEVAHELFSALAYAYRKTAENLHQDAKKMWKKASEKERLAEGSY